jgi:hypothetical protein
VHGEVLLLLPTCLEVPGMPALPPDCPLLSKGCLSALSISLEAFWPAVSGVLSTASSAGACHLVKMQHTTDFQQAAESVQEICACCFAGAGAQCSCEKEKEVSHLKYTPGVCARVSRCAVLCCWLPQLV